MLTTSTICARIPLQACLRAIARYGRRSVLAADHVALGERADLREIVKLSGVLIDLYCASYATPPQAVTLDIDDTCDVAHGHQQLSLFNAHYDERCFLPIHVYDTATGRPWQSFCDRAKRRPARKCAAFAPDRSPHPRTLAEDQDHHPRRWSLWPPRGDGLVRGQ